jgi:hypothetical protein
MLGNAGYRKMQFYDRELYVGGAGAAAAAS